MSKGKRSVEQPAGNLAAVRHLAQRRSLDCRRDLRRHSLYCRKYGDAGFAKADVTIKINRILYDVALNIEVRRNIDGGIRDEDCLVVCRNVHNEHVADTARRTKASSNRTSPRA